MADITQQVIVEFIINDSQLQPAIDLLEKTGQIDAKLANGFRQTTAEINKQATAIKADAAATAPLKKNLEDVSKSVKNMSASFMQGFQEGVIDTLKEAGVTAQQFTDALSTGQTEVEGTTESLRQRLKILTQQIAQLKLTGEDNTEQFRAMVLEAGRIKDAVGDAGQEIKNAASDTRVFDNLIGAVQAVAGGFAVAQGTAALFGDENEELQKTLLKVNAAMAILQGLQSIQNALKKEGAITQLIENKQRLIANAQLAIENGLQSQSVIVRTAAAAAQRILNAAMNANPILLFISALVLVVSAMAAYISSSREAERQTGQLNSAVEDATDGFENYAEGIKRESEKVTSELQKNGALQSKILQTQLQAEIDIDKKRREEIAKLREFLTRSRDADEEAIKAATDRLAQLAKDSTDAEVEIIKSGNDIKKQLREEDLKSRIADAETALTSAEEGSRKQLELQKKLVSLQAQQSINAAGLTEAEKNEINAKALKARQELDIAFNKREIDLQLKSIQTRLINAEEGSREEFDLKIKQIRLQTQSELQNTRLSEKEKAEIRRGARELEEKETRARNTRLRIEAIEGEISINNAVLANVKTSAEDRLLLTISNIELAAVNEIESAKGNAKKIDEINAKRDADIAGARKAFIEQQAALEIDLTTAREGVNRRMLQRLAEDEKKSVRDRIVAIQQLAELDLDNIQTREDALEEERQKRLIGEEEYNLRYAQLQDEKAKITEDTEKKVTDIHKSETEKRRKQDQETIELVIQTTQQVIDLIGQLNDIRNQKDEERIEKERARVQELREAGAITEKEAILRNKRIDNEERKLKRQAAIRDKQIAIFNAVVNTAQAVTRALATGGPILAAIAGALGAAQIAIIASRPIPKFKTGKKNRYEGLGEVGEAGAELIESNGNMYLAKKSTIVWLGKEDKVYTPTETRQLMPHVDKEIMDWKPEQPGIDPEKFAITVGAAVAAQLKKMPQTNLNVNEEGFKTWTQEGMSRKSYMDKYYSSK